VLSDRPDADVLDKAVQAASALYPIATCADTDALTARVRPPEDPAVRARVAALQPRVDQLEALHTAGKHKQGLALGEPLLAEVSALPYPPLRAEVQFWVGRLRAGAGDYAGARAALDDAALSAAEGHDDVLEASTWAELLFLVSENQQRLDEAAVIYELGRGPVARALDERAQATWLSSVGAFLGRKGAFAESKAAYARVVALREKTFGPDHPLVGAAVHNLASLLNETGEWPEAKAMYERALAIKEKTLGPEHPSVALSLNNLGVALRNMGRYAEAIVAYERALALWERTLGLEHPRLATALTNLGEARCDSGDALGAIPLFERALALRQKALGPDHPDLAYTLDGLGRAKTHLGQLDAAQLLLSRALALKEKAFGPANPELAGPLLSLGELALARGKPDEARPLLERALSLHAKQRAPLQLALAEALWRADKDRPRSRALAEEARAIYAGVDHRPGMERASRWLTEHAAR
jgi:serine/threonine-protein kinase